MKYASWSIGRFGGPGMRGSDRPEAGLSVPTASQITAVLHARLRRSPTAHSVVGSLPVLFFGDLFSARVATVGLNPSDQEFLDRSGEELEGTSRRFESLRSLGALDRESLEVGQCERAIATMRRYYL